jgi:hypothetical protein
MWDRITRRNPTRLILMSDTNDKSRSGVKRIEECAVCGKEVEIGGVPPEYYFSLDQSDVRSHKVQMAPNPSGEFACSYDCLQTYEERNARYSGPGPEQGGGDE